MNAKVAAAGIFVIVGFVGVRLVTFMQEADKQVNRQAYEDGYYKMPADEQLEEIIPMDLPGLPQQLQASYDAVYDKDAATLEAWLKMYRPYVKDPKLSEIELDCIVKIGRTDPPKARKLFSEVAARNGPDSPLRERIDTLSKTYR